MDQLTNRDREYLRVLYVLNGFTDPVGPVLLSKKIGVSKVCAFQKMRRLEALGYGKYVLRKGLKLNKKACSLVEQDVKKHHVLEAFLQKKLGLTHHQACIESEKLDSSVSQTLFNKINSTLMKQVSSCCRYNPKEELTVSDLKKCPWMKRLLCNTEEVKET